MDGGASETCHTGARARGVFYVNFLVRFYVASFCQRVDGKGDIQTSILRSTMQRTGIRVVAVRALLDSRISSQSEGTVQKRDGFLIRYI